MESTSGFFLLCIVVCKSDGRTQIQPFQFLIKCDFYFGGNVIVEGNVFLLFRL